MRQLGASKKPRPRGPARVAAVFCRRPCAGLYVLTNHRHFLLPFFFLERRWGVRWQWRSSCDISSWVPVLKDSFSDSTLCSSSILRFGLVFLAPAPCPLLFKGVWSSEDGWRVGLAGTELVEVKGERRIFGLGQLGPANPLYF